MVFKLRPIANGGHITVTFFSAPKEDQTFANIGHLVMDDKDWDALFEIFRYVGNVLIDPCGSSKELRQGWRTQVDPFGDEVNIQVFKDSYVKD